MMPALYAAVYILAERFFYFTGKQFPVKKDLFPNFENEVFTMSLLFLKEKRLVPFQIQFTIIHNLLCTSDK